MLIPLALLSCWPGDGPAPLTFLLGSSGGVGELCEGFEPLGVLSFCCAFGIVQVLQVLTPIFERMAVTTSDCHWLVTRKLKPSEVLAEEATVWHTLANLNSIA